MGRLNAALSAICVAVASACLAATPATAQTIMTNSIQPETTISLTGNGSVERKPDMATINVGVNVDAETAATAMSQQSQKMNAVYAALRASGIVDRDIQTSSISLNPVYDYSNQNGRPRLTGYAAFNEVTIRVRKLDNLGKALDAIVKAGGNTINNVAFGVADSKEALNAARVAAIQDATARAELYAKAAGYKVKRIVTISEIEGYAPPMPVARMAMDSAESTPISGGEVSLGSSVSVTFELTR